ncbi:MAG: urease accessory protein UreF [Alphaproteobacteria bacterium]|nr:urease accessory protein UreF [Alphaproteobacteria bacterium]
MTTNLPVAGQDLLRVLAWFSPSFPVGAFSYSHAIEYAVEARMIDDRDGLIEWVDGAVTRGSGRIDAALFCAAYNAVADDSDADLLWALERGDTMRATRELAGESIGQGEAFLETIRNTWPHVNLDRLAALARDEQRRLAYPVAVGAAVAAHDVPASVALPAYLHSLAANLVSAGVRLIPLGQTDGQRAIAALEPVILAAAEAALIRPRCDLGSAAPVIDWASMQHETQYTRLFRS